jgi:hypothetical protein
MEFFFSPLPSSKKKTSLKFFFGREGGRVGGREKKDVGVEEKNSTKCLVRSMTLLGMRRLRKLFLKEK